MAIQSQSTQTGARIIGNGSETAAGPGPDIMAANTLEGNRVLSSDDQDLGKIKEIMLDVQRGRIAYAVLSSGGFLGIGDKLLALPWSALTLDTTQKCFLLNVTAEHVKNAPGFDKEGVAEHGRYRLGHAIARVLSRRAALAERSARARGAHRIRGAD